MKKHESQRPRRGHPTRAERLWNAAALGGLLLIGLLLGGVAGVFLDRQGLLGENEDDLALVTTVEPELPIVRPAVDPRIIKGAPAFDREALEAQYQAADPPEAEGPAASVETPPAAAENVWQGDAASAYRPNPAPGQPVPWQQHAVAVEPSGGRPMIAIVLDDVGVNRRGARKAIALPGPLTLSFMTYARDLPAMTAEARQAGHELMLHVPMQPRRDDLDPGPNVLRADLPPGELRQRLAWGLARFEGYVGINNHMGSRFTASPDGMALVMEEVRARGLLFLDSLTAANSVAGAQAAEAGVPYAVRDTFIDNEPDDLAAIHRQLALLEQRAREQGYAIGIGHPHDGTVTALEAWIPEMRERGFALVPISAIVRHRQRLAENAIAGAG